MAPGQPTVHNTLPLVHDRGVSAGCPLFIPVERGSEWEEVVVVGVIGRTSGVGGEQVVNWVNEWWG